jgi:hypothetical protein
VVRGRNKAQRTKTIATAALQFYRLAVVIAIAWLIRDHHVRLRVQGDRPITVSEVANFLPDAHRLTADPSTRAGLFVSDKSGTTIGYAARTMPWSRDITGYSGPTDALVVFDPEDRVLGVSIRHSYDTPSHVSDVTGDFLFMETWNGRSWDEIAAVDDLAEAEIWGVSGASRTSEALAWSLTERTRQGLVSPVDANSSARFQVRWQDGALLLILIGGCLFAFVKKAAFQRRRIWFSIVAFVVLGFVLGDLLAQSLLVGWAQSRIPWEQTPGLVLFAGACFIIPWFSRQPVYCQFICPHGHAQRWLMKWTPARWQVRLGSNVKWAMKTLPVLLLAAVLVVSFFDLPFDLAGIEPFDAYLLTAAGIATVVIAIVGLIAAAFVPMAYCKYGCPTGLLLDFFRRRTAPDKATTRDLVALLFLIAAVCLWHFHTPMQSLLFDR